MLKWAASAVTADQTQAVVHRHPAHRVTRGWMLRNGGSEAGHTIADGLFEERPMLGVEQEVLDARFLGRLGAHLAQPVEEVSQVGDDVAGVLWRARRPAQAAGVESG